MPHPYRLIFLAVLFSSSIIIGYGQNIQKDTDTKGTIFSSRPSSLGILGDTTDVQTPTRPGMVLMGGGKDVDAAFQWMIARSGGGNVVVIRASGTNAYNPYIFALGKISSVETLKIDSRELANNDTVVRIIQNAEMLFIAGGDQSVYMNQWKGTKTAGALNYLLNIKKVPVGGTSAGCAVLGQIYYSGEGGSVVSKEALENPYEDKIKLYKNDFLQARYLENVITDQHYITRSRVGRHIVYMSRIITDWNIFPKGIAADEKTAVCINEKGIARVLGTGKAFFILSDKQKRPEQCSDGKPLKWIAHRRALKVYELQGTNEVAGSFNVKRFSHPGAKGGSWHWWWVENGKWQQSLIE